MLDLPKVDRRQNIGLIGGSFDPPHEGHMHVAKWALRSLPLDKLWWVVSKRNPLKKQSTTDFKNRIKITQKLVKQPKMLVTDLEAVFDTEFTVDFLSKVKSEYPKGNFIWIMGADGLNNFHEWKHWEKIFEMIPIAIFARPNYSDFLTTVAGKKYSKNLLPENRSNQLMQCKAPAWAFFDIPLKNISSTEIRNRKTS
jgi:nicotinate-nucleotide adenylyltransferase